MRKGERSIVDGILEYTNMLLTYKWLIISITALAAVGIVIFVIISIKLPPEKSPLPNTYQAAAILVIEENEELSIDSILGLSDPAPRQNTDLGLMAYRILTTRSFLDKVVEELDIPGKYGIIDRNKIDSRMAILNRTQHNYDRNTRTLVFSYEDTDPKFARDILNRMVELLIDWFSSKGSTSKLSKKTILEQKLAELSVAIAELEDKIQAFQRKHKVLSVEEIATIQTDIISNLRTQLVLKEMEIKNYSEFTRIEDSKSIRLKAERDNILETIEQVEKGYSSEGNYSMPSREELPQLSQEFSHLVSDLQIQRRIYETLSQQYEVSKLSLESSSIYQVLEWAEIPQQKAGPKRGQLCVLVTIGAFLFSCALVFVINFIKSIKFVPQKRVKNVY